MASRARRSAFATPLVVVLGCGVPSTEPVTPQVPPRTDPPIDAALPVDAPVSTGADARIANANPPGVLVLRLLKVEVSGSAVEVTFDKGSKAGLRNGMKGY